MLHPVDTISLCAERAETETTAPSCELVVDDVATGQRVDGCWLRAVYQCPAGYVLFLRHDRLFEDALSIYLLDAAGALKDEALLGWAYADGCFANLEIEPPDTLSFDFFDRTRHQYGTIWKVRVLPVPVFRLPLVCEPMEVARPFRFKRHFILSAHARPYPRVPTTTLQ